MKTRDGVLSLPTGGVAFAAGSRVKLASGVLALAGATEVEIGVVEKTTLTGDAYAAVRTLPACGALELIAAGAIGQYADVYRAANGRVSATVAAGHQLGVALQAASGAGSVVEVSSRF